MRPVPPPLRPLVLLVALAALAAALAGCSSQSNVLAKVGDRTITVDDFVDVAARNQGQYAHLTDPDSAKAALLDDLVKRELVVVEALQRGLIPPQEQARLLQQAKEQLAMRLLIQQLAPAGVPVSDAEVKALHERRAREARLLVVFTVDRASCEQALAELRRGADFSATADRFNVTGLTPPRGDLGYVTAGMLMPVLDDVVSDSPVGQVVGPLELPANGWFLAKVTDRRPRPQEPLEQVGEALRRGLQEGKQRALLSRVQGELLAQYHVTVAPGAVRALFARHNLPADTTTINGIRVPVPAAPTAAEAREVLVRYDDADGRTAAYTLGDAALDLQDASKPPPNWAMLPMIEQWLKNAVLQRVASIEARRRHLGEDEAHARRARAQMENVLLQAAYEALVLGPARATEADLQAAYQRHVAQLPTRNGAPVEFAALEPAYQQALQNEALEFARERLLREVTGALSARLKPELHRERLKRIPWPVPPPPPGD